MSNENTATIRFRESATRLPKPAKLSDVHRPMPGELELPLGETDYQEIAYGEEKYKPVSY